MIPSHDSSDIIFSGLVAWRLNYGAVIFPLLFVVAIVIVQIVKSPVNLATFIYVPCAVTRIASIATANRTFYFSGSHRYSLFVVGYRPQRGANAEFSYAADSHLFEEASMMAASASKSTRKPTSRSPILERRIFALIFCKQADPRFHHRGYSLVVVDFRILPRSARTR